MEADEKEEKLLRSVALQNANSILLARERAERELIKAKETLEQLTQELRQQREWFRVTLSSIGDAVITTDTQSRVTFLNPVAEKMTGWKLAEASGQPLEKVFRIINETTRQPTSNPVAKVLQEGVVIELANHTALVAKDGRETAIEDSAAPIRDSAGHIAGAIMVFHDVTERRRAEAALRASEDRLSATFNQAAVGIAIAQLDGRFERVNRRFSTTLAYTPEELYERTFLELTHPDDLPQTHINVRRLLAGEISDFTHEKRYLRKDGAVVWSLTSVTLLKDAVGQAQRFVGVVEDITQRKQMEEALREAQEKLSRHAEELEKQVAERTATLRETIGELEAFSYSISHDMRAPLRAMQSFALILAEECSAQVSPEGKGYIRRITTAAERMDRLIRDVLTYSRVARTELPLSSIDAENLLREIIESYPQFQAPAAEIQLAGSFPPVLATEAVLMQCISNILGNAVKFIAPGVTPQVCVWAESSADGSRVQLLFRDNGLGIEQAAHESIFGIFQRVSPSYDGTGIGLAIVKKGMERMGGKVGLRSEPGRGSTFWLELRRGTTEEK